MAALSKLSAIIRGAVSDFAAHASEQTPAEWLQSYLGANLPGRSAEAISSISGEIIATLDLMEQKQAAMESAVSRGKTAESWLASDLTAGTESNGSTARRAAEFLSGIVAAQPEEAEAFDAQIIDEEAAWTDDEWNDFKLKDSLKGVAAEAGRAGLRELASDVFLKASEEGGLSEALTDGEFLTESVINAAGSGLKVAVTAGLTVAQDRGLIGSTTVRVLAATAHKTIESLSAIGDVIRGRKTIVEAVTHIKNTAVATFSGLWHKHKDAIKSEVISAVGTVFGPKGAAIAGAIAGAVTPEKGKSRIVSALKGAAKAVVGFLTKERHLPFFNRNKNKALTMSEA